MCDYIFSRKCDKYSTKTIVELAKALKLYIDTDARLELCRKICEYINSNGLTKENFKLHLLKLELMDYMISVDDKLILSTTIQEDIINNFSVSNIGKKLYYLRNNSSNGVLLGSSYKLDQTLSVKVIIKHNTNINNDNIYYEYLVGRCINRFKSMTPFFINTCGLYEYSTYLDIDTLVKNSRSEFYDISKLELKNNTSRNLLDKVLNACEGREYGLVIQHINHRVSIADLCDIILSVLEEEDEEEDQYNPEDLIMLINSLYLVYMTLDKWRNIFTHYDLHAENIILYEIPHIKYLEVIVKYIDGEVKFNTNYVPIIIDYGRSYIDCDTFTEEILNSSKFLSKVCTTEQCPSKCGNERGFNFVGEKNGEEFLPTSEKDYFINTARKNISHDLRLLSILRDYYNFHGLHSKLSGSNKDILGSFIDLLTSLKYDRFGTAENLTVESDQILNVRHAHQKLKKIVESATLDFSRREKYGTLTIYADTNQSFEFIPTQPSTELFT
jgi:hypothetical protein